MSRVFEFRVKVTRGEYERVKADAYQKGYKTLSSYFRHRIFGEARVIEEKIVESHKILKLIESQILATPKNTYTTIRSPDDIQKSQTKA